MLKVVLSVDTEFWPCVAAWPNHSQARPLTGLDEAYQRGVLGRTPTGDYGLPYLLQSLRRHNLRGVFFVESLSSCVAGDASLSHTVRAILEAGQEVQLHLHTEWLSEAFVPGLPLQHHQNLGEYTLEEQTAIARYGLSKLRAAGAHSVTALRAGNMGGNRDTPVAARAAGLALDMSFDPSRGDETRSLLQTMRDASRVDSTCPTVPLSFVEDYPGHFRPAQLTALSFGELRRALLKAAQERWPCFVIILHSFELVRPIRHPLKALCRHRINIRRWNKLCAFLARHRDLFMTVGCLELNADPASTHLPKAPRTIPSDTLWRIGEQVASRFI